MKTIGYARVSTYHQNFKSQICALKKYGCTQIYTEQESGCKKKRPQLDKAIGSLKEGDTFVIYKLDRLSRGTKQLLTLLDYFNEHEINFVSIENNIDTTTSMGKFFFTVMGAFAEMEAAFIRERVISGLSAAKESGVTLGRPAKNKNFENVIDQYLNTNLSVTEIARRNEISRPTVYRYLKLQNVTLKNKDDK